MRKHLTLFASRILFSIACFVLAGALEYAIENNMNMTFFFMIMSYLVFVTSIKLEKISTIECKSLPSNSTKPMKKKSNWIFDIVIGIIILSIISIIVGGTTIDTIFEMVMIGMLVTMGLIEVVLAIIEIGDNVDKEKIL